MSIYLFLIGLSGLLIGAAINLALRQGKLTLVAALMCGLLAVFLGKVGFDGYSQQATPQNNAISENKPLAFHLDRQHGQFQTIAPIDLDRALSAAKGSPVLLDFYAEWCVSCEVWNKEVFSQPMAQQALAQHVLLKIDATEYTPDVQAVLERFEVIGLPTLLLFSEQGEERKERRIIGEMALSDFLDWVAT